LDNRGSIGRHPFLPARRRDAADFAAPSIGGDHKTYRCHSIRRCRNVGGLENDRQKIMRMGRKPLRWVNGMAVPDEAMVGSGAAFGGKKRANEA
jgi:hypothetical protein